MFGSVFRAIGGALSGALRGVAGAVLPGLGAALPAAAAGGLSLAGIREQNAANMAMAQNQMDFQERMSSTAYQRATADMRLAGINPMLAYMQGGASSPGGATAQIQDAIGPAVSSAVHVSRLAQELRLMAAQRRVQDTAADRNVAEAGMARQGTVESMSRAQLNEATRRNTEVQTRLGLASLPTRQLTGSLASGLQPLVNMTSEGYRRLSGVLRGTQSAADRARDAIFDSGYRIFNRVRSLRERN